MFDNLSSNGIIAAALIAPPGPDVITALARVDPTRLCDYIKVDFMVAIDRQAAWLEALSQPAVAAVGDSVQTLCREGDSDQFSAELALRAAHCEIAAALRVSDNVAGNKLRSPAPSPPS
jgi:hypothetical protein